MSFYLFQTIPPSKNNFVENYWSKQILVKKDLGQKLCRYKKTFVDPLYLLTIKGTMKEFIGNFILNKKAVYVGVLLSDVEPIPFIE